MMTKEEKIRLAFAEQGIEYKKGKILAPWGAWIPMPLNYNTNTKIGNAATFSLYHGNEIFTIDMVGEKTAAVMLSAGIESIQASCPYHCPGCYCDAGNYRYDSTKAALMLRLILARYYMDFLRRAIIAQINAFGIEQVRIHAAGDFFSAEYALMWKDIATTCPGVIFWTYTKDPIALDIISPVPNIFITPSCTPFGFNYGKCGYLLEIRKKLLAMGKKVHICACGTPYEKHCADCKTGCKAIGTSADYVLFIMHSVKGYKAGKTDPEDYKKILAIIAEQDN